MSLTNIIPSPDDLKRTMGQMPPLTAGLNQPPGPEPPSGLSSLGALPSLGGSQQPSIPMGGLKPIVSSPRQQQEQALQAGLAKKPEGFWQNLRHVTGMAGRIAGDIVAPGQTELITRGLGREGIGPDANAFRTKQLAGLQGQDLAEQKQASESGLQLAQAGAAELVPASQAEADAFGVPLGTPLNAATRAALAKQATINATKIATTHETNQTRQNVAGMQALSRETIAQLKPMQRDDRAIAINQKLAEGQQITPEEQSYLKAYEKYIDQTKIQPGVARAQAYSQFRPVAAINPETGEPEWNYAAQAVSQHMGTTANIPFRTAAAISRFMTSGKGGQTVTAYNTANDHLELLGKAMDALQNGDVQALNQMQNAFKQQFGSAAPTNVDAVKAMLSGELANVAKVTGATDQEIKEQKDNLNRAASPEQIRGFIDTNHDLMDQKAYELYQQYNQGMQGKPAFDTGLSGRRPANGKPQNPPSGQSTPKIGDKKNGFTFDGRGWTK